VTARSVTGALVRMGIEHGGEPPDFLG
jgi:hypothetical protein